MKRWQRGAAAAGLLGAVAAWLAWPRAEAPDLPALAGGATEDASRPRVPAALAHEPEVPAPAGGDAGPGIAGQSGGPGPALAADAPEAPPDPFTRDAIKAEMAALLAEQQPDGSWRGGEVEGRVVGETGTTALALMALLGAGHVPGEATSEARAAARALEFLSRRAGAGGRLGGSDLEHNLATMALAEVCGLAPDAGAGDTARAAVAQLLEARAAGRWASNFGDLPIQTYEAVWGVLALVSARLCELGDHSAEREAVSAWLTAQQPSGAGARVAAGAARTFVERRADHAALIPELDRAMAAGPAAADFNTLYFGSLVAFQIGGEAWGRWRSFMAEAIRHAESAAARDPRQAPLSRPMLLLVREILSRYTTPAPAADAAPAARDR